MSDKKPTKIQAIQDRFLNQLRKEHVPVSVYLVNGIKLQGQIQSFDPYVVLLKNSISQMVYKHAISTVVPSKDVALDNSMEDDDDEFYSDDVQPEYDEPQPGNL